MTELTKGNYERDAKITLTDEWLSKNKKLKKTKSARLEKPVSTHENSFEEQVLENLGGSIAFVRPKKGEPLIE